MKKLLTVLALALALVGCADTGDWESEEAYREDLFDAVAEVSALVERHGTAAWELEIGSIHYLGYLYHWDAAYQGIGEIIEEFKNTTAPSDWVDAHNGYYMAWTHARSAILHDGVWYETFDPEAADLAVRQWELAYDSAERGFESIPEDHLDYYPLPIH